MSGSSARPLLAHAPTHSPDEEQEFAEPGELENRAAVLESPRARYTIESVQTKGGFAKTYRARVMGTETRVFIKELSLSRADSWKAVELFEREAQAMSVLSHPSIPRLFEHFTLADGDAKTRFFIVQEFIEGPNLFEDVTAHGAWTPDRIEPVLRELLQALRHLQEQPVPFVHRDIKPQNVILGANGRVHLVDFGAVQTRPYAANTRGSTIVGTPGYMPPEQLMGHATPAADIYALGMTMLCALSGTGPEGLVLDDLTGRVNVRRSLPRLSPRLAQVLQKMVEVGPGARFSTAASVLLALDAPPAKEKRPWLSAASALLLIGSTLGLTTWALVHHSKPVPAPRSTVVSNADPSPAPQPAPAPQTAGDPDVDLVRLVEPTVEELRPVLHACDSNGDGQGGVVPGSVVIDLFMERGGRVRLARPVARQGLPEHAVQCMVDVLQGATFSPKILEGSRIRIPLNFLNAAPPP
jgi:serine/threonine protein kinase